MSSKCLPWALSLLIVLACADRTQDPPAADLDPGPSAASQAPSVPPREKVAGLWGVEVWTRVSFPDQPEVPHRLQTLLAFPARTRWVLAPEDNPLGQVRLVYEYGERLFLVEPGTPDSIEMIGDSLREQRRNMALRRALFVPEAFPWSEASDGSRGADLGEAGRLVAHGPAQRPQRIESWSAADEASLSLVDIRWEDPAAEADRAWPSAWRLELGEQVLWEETLTRGEVLGGVFTRSFLPPDRRTGEHGSPGTPTAGSRGPCWILLGALPSDVAWDEAELAAELAVQRELDAGRQVEIPASFTLRADGRPAQVRLVLPPDSSPPAPWQRDGGASHLLEMHWGGDELPSPAAVREALEELRRLAEGDGRFPSGAAFLQRLPEGQGQRLVQDVRAP